MATDESNETERIQHRQLREIEELLRAVTLREPDIEGLWVRDDPEPRPRGSRVYSLVEQHGDILEVRVRSYDVNREGFHRNHHCLLDKAGRFAEGDVFCDAQSEEGTQANMKADAPGSPATSRWASLCMACAPDEVPAEVRLHVPVTGYTMVYCRKHAIEHAADFRESYGVVWTRETIRPMHGRRGKHALAIMRLSDALAEIEAKGEQYALKLNPGDSRSVRPRTLRRKDPEERLMSETELMWYDKPIADIVGHLAVAASAHHDAFTYMIVEVSDRA